MQKIIFELQVQDANVATQLELLKGNLRDINKELKLVDQDSKAFQSLTEEAVQTRLEIAKLTEQQKQLKKEFTAAQVPTDSLVGLRLEYGKLVDQINRLSKAERETKAGQELVKNAAALKTEINDIQESVGNFTGSVGNYKNGILAAFDVLQQFGGSLGQQAGLLNAARQGFDVASEGAARFGAAFGSGIEKLKEGVQQVKDYLSSLRESKKVQTEAADAAQEVGEAVGEAATEGVKAGAAMNESAKGATLFGRAGTALRGILSSLGIGLVITLVTTLISAFQKFAPIVDFVEQAVAGLSAAFDVLVSRAGQFFNGISKILDGDFAGAFDEIGSSVSGIGGAMVNAATAAAGLTKELQDLEDAQKDFVLTNARAEAAVARLTVALKDRTKSDGERLKIAGQITKIETDNLNTKISLIDKEIEVEKRRLLLTGQVTQQQADQIAAGNFDLARQLEDSFKLQQDQTDKIRDLLVQRTNAEGESAVLLERVENRRNAILDAAAQKREANEKKKREAIEKENKLLEDQLKRINDLQKGIRDLDATTILNEFDQRATEIENKRADALEKLAQQRAALKKKIQDAGGVIKESDIQEEKLIDEQTASIIAAYQQQLDAVTAARQKARDDQQAELQQLSLQVTRLAQENAQALAEIEGEIINADFSKQQAQLKAVLADRQKALNDELISGSITRKQYQKETVAAQEAFNVETAKLERERVQAQIKLAEELKAAKILTARAALNVELSSINEARNADIEALRERAKREGIDTTEEIAARDKRAAEERAQAYQEYAIAVNDASQALTQAQIDGADAVNQADQKVHEDKLRRLEEEKVRRQKLQDFLVEQASVIARSILQIDSARLQEQTDTALSELEKEYERRKELAANNQAQLTQLEKQYQSEKERLEKQAANKRKQIALKEAVIEGAVAVVKALPNLFLAAAAAIATIAQIAVINSQTFAHGGVLRKQGTFAGPSHAKGGVKGYFSDGTRVEVEGDEDFIILNKRASAERRRLSNLNYQFGGRRFDAGGVLDFTPQVGVPGSAGGAERIVVVAQAYLTDEQMKEFAGMVAKETGAAAQSGIGNGLEDNNRNKERQAAMIKNREG